MAVLQLGPTFLAGFWSGAGPFNSFPSDLHACPSLRSSPQPVPFWRVLLKGLRLLLQGGGWACCSELSGLFQVILTWGWGFLGVCFLGRVP